MNGSGLLIEYVQDRAGHDTRYSIDPQKAERDLNWMPKISFDEALSATIDFYTKSTPNYS